MIWLGASSYILNNFHDLGLEKAVKAQQIMLEFFFPELEVAAMKSLHFLTPNICRLKPWMTGTVYL